LGADVAVHGLLGQIAKLGFPVLAKADGEREEKENHHP
jgi:hypothetical protein